jgi:hypothetical protein
MPEVRTRRVDDPEDILVKEVTEKLGIQGWRVQELPPVAAVNTDERE